MYYLLFANRMSCLNMDRNLMSPQEIRKMEALAEDDNPVILKYYLK